MTTRASSGGRGLYLEYSRDERIIKTEQDVVDLIARCSEVGTTRLVLYEESLPRAFFDLKSGFAGMVLQKLTDYHIRAAFIISSATILKGRFREMAIECNRGHQFRFFSDRRDAENWLNKRHDR